MNPQVPNNQKPCETNGKTCSVCRELLASLEQFFYILDTVRKSPSSDWLTVDDVAKELKISKSIVYRLIHHRQLEAIDTGNSEKRKKGHYRIERQSLDSYLEARKIKAMPEKPTRPCPCRPKHLREVKNHLGL